MSENVCLGLIILAPTSPQREAEEQQGIKMLVIGVSQLILVGLESNLVTAGSSLKTISHDRNGLGKTGQTGDVQTVQYTP